MHRDVKRGLKRNFEHGINFSINQIRGALSDSAEKPRYVETVPRRGYRFIGTVEQPSPAKQDSTQEPTPPPLQAEPIAPRALRIISGAGRKNALVTQRSVVSLAHIHSRFTPRKWSPPAHSVQLLG
jgi:hypothetical protein